MKKVILCLFTIGMLINSCTNETTPLPSQDVDITSIRKKASLTFYGNSTKSVSENNISNIDDETNQQLTDFLEHSLNYAIQNDASKLLEENNINTHIVTALYEYENSDKSDKAFTELAHKYKFNEQDIYYFALSVETHDYLVNNNLLPSDNDMKTKASGRQIASCSVAVASSVLVTVGAIAIPTGAGAGFGLGLFLAGKALALASLALCA